MGRIISVFLVFGLFFLITNIQAEEIKFKSSPTATKKGDKTQIVFEVSTATDVTIFIENAQGKIIRHLVSGVLGGQNPPPAPLKPGLAQDLEWDGKADYGQVAEGGPFKVRIALGLGAKYDKVLSRRPLSFAGTCSLGTGPDGTLYLRHQYLPSVWHHSQIIALNRDGTYQKTLIPFASTPDSKEAKGHDVMELEGRLVPAGRANERDTFASINGPNFSNLAISPDGKDMYGLAGSAGIIRLSTSGGCPEGELVTYLEKNKNGIKQEPVYFNTAFISVSSDNKKVFFNGITNRYAPAPLSAIFSIGAPSRTNFEVFFGDPLKPGNDQEHLSAVPGNMTNDGKGNLLIADTGNGRIVVVGEADGKFKGEFKTESPRGIGVDRRSGAIYVTNDKDGFIFIRKYNGWMETKLTSECKLPRKGWTANHSMAIDASTDPVVIWVSAGGDGYLVRVEDQGTKFDIKEISADWRGGQPQECYLSLNVDRRTKEVYVRNGGSGGIWERFNEENDKSELIKLPSDAWSDGGGKGTQLLPHPNGNLYGIKWEHEFFQWDRNGKPLAWTEPRIPSEEELKGYDYYKTASKSPHVNYVPVGMTELPHTLGVRWSDGHLFVLEPKLFKSGGRSFKALHEYLPSGKRITTVDAPILWKISDGAVGPKFDAAGNIYVAEFIRPKGWYYPPEIKEYLEKKGIVGLKGKAASFTSLYGSILKFSPKGGMVHWPLGAGRDGVKGVPSYNEGSWAGLDPFDGEPKLDPEAKKWEGEFYSWDNLRPLSVTGAEWMFPGVGNVGMFRCNCENITFEVDEFGRTFFPDMCLFQIKVIDTAGNAITHFGSYGNPENCGPDSPVIDAKTGKLRMRQASDPQDLKSPYAEPDIAIAWPAGLGVTDKYAYIGDAVNRRLLRAKIVYAKEETCAIK